MTIEWNDEDPDFSVFQEPPDDAPSPSQPISRFSVQVASTAAQRFYQRLSFGPRKNTRKRTKISRKRTVSSTEISDNFSVTNDFSDDGGIDEDFDDYPAFYKDPVLEQESPANNMVNVEEKKILKTWSQTIMEEMLAFFVCIVYLVIFNTVFGVVRRSYFQK